ncbi:MAG: dockerin type I repeat-containing protein, partial [Gemmatimonadota bacterium]|nr:dockerin type I repeat-containing protein [Gemmatimonadota bacterium]
MKTSFTFLVAAVLSVYSPSVDPGSLLIAQQHSDAGVTTSGDLNGDGFFDIIDLVSLEEAVVLGALAGAGELSACDVDGDGKLTTFDLLVMNDALSNYNEGMDMFDAVKSAIEKDIEKSGDNVAIYLDLARFYRKEKQFYKASNVLRNILEAMDPSHPLYETVQRTLSNLKEEEKNRNMEEEDFLNQEIYRTAEDPTGKVGLRRKVIQMQSRLSNLIKQKDFAAHYNSKRVKARLNSAMEEMLRQVGKDHMVDPDAFQDFNYTVQDIMENPENLTRGLNDEQREKIAKIVNSHTSEMQGEAERIRREISAKQVKVKQSPNAGQEDLTREALLDRRDWRREKNRDNLRIDRHIVANKPEFEPDTISIVAPSYVIKWDVSNVLGARDAALEISKANRAFSNPRGTTVDQANTLYYTPSLNGISGR